MGSRYRVWIVRYDQRQPAAWHGMPDGAIAIEPAERGSMTPRQARRYVEAFNRVVEGSPRKIWAVALPVAVCYMGDPQPGETLALYLPIANNSTFLVDQGNEIRRDP